MVLPPPSSYTLKSFRWLADWDRDGTYGAANADISSYVLQCEYRWGMNKAYQEVAPPARMVLTLDNSSGAWSVAKSTATFSSLFKKGVLVKMSFTNTGDQVRDRFIGTITDLQLLPGIRGQNIAILTVEDPMLRLLNTEYYSPLLTNVTTDAALSQLFEDATIAYPYPHQYWMLGIDGASELESTTTVFENTITDFETGGTTLAFVGDNADGGSGVSAQAYLRDVVLAEAGGKLFWDAVNGKFVFWNRYHVSDIDTSLAASAGEVVLDAPIEYHFADDLNNIMNVEYELKQVGTSADILYTSPNLPLSIIAGNTRKFTARYQDPDVPTARVGGINMIPPLAGLDYIANTASDGSGSDVTSNLGISVQFNASSANITLYNSTAATLYVTKLQLRGTALISHARETAQFVDGVSVFAYGEFRRRMFLPLVQSAEFAQDYATALVSRFRTPLSRFERLTRDLTFEPNAAALSVTVGSVFKYHDEKLEDDDTVYMVVGEEGLIRGGNNWQVTYVLEPVERNVFWILGVTEHSELGETTILAL
jgi:hypothetical protein